ncbi:MAG: hypothetical protein HOO67_06240 [Candidatus Peribacteraceae bacterium]|nr:hypothetical protein [Candidatus Peribacteraceae bacterium]
MDRQILVNRDPSESTDRQIYDRRNDVGSKVFWSIMTGILTTIFLGSLGLGIRNYEINNRQDIELTTVREYMKTQARLNDKLDAILDGSKRLPGVFYQDDQRRMR